MKQKSDKCKCNNRSTVWRRWIVSLRIYAHMHVAAKVYCGKFARHMERFELAGSLAFFSGRKVMMEDPGGFRRRPAGTNA
jgi:hypothetical protein